MEMEILSPASRERLAALSNRLRRPDFHRPDFLGHYEAARDALRRRVTAWREAAEEHRVPIVSKRGPDRGKPADGLLPTAADVRHQFEDIQRTSATEKKEPKGIFKFMDGVSTFLKETAPNKVAEVLFKDSLESKMQSIYADPERYERRINKELQQSLHEALFGKRNGMRNFQERMLALSLIPDPMFGILLAPAFTVGTLVLTNGYNTVKAFARGDVRKGLVYAACTLVNPIPATLTAITLAKTLPAAIAAQSIELIQNAGEQLAAIQFPGLLLGLVTNTAIYERISGYHEHAMTLGVLETARTVLSNDSEHRYHKRAIERIGRNLVSAKKTTPANDLASRLETQLQRIGLAQAEVNASRERILFERQLLEEALDKSKRRNFFVRSFQQIGILGKMAKRSGELVDLAKREKLLAEFQKFFTLMKPAQEESSAATPVPDRRLMLFRRPSMALV